MKLRYSGLSPYVRKVMVTAHELGIASRIELVPTNARERPEELRPINPLGKIPALTTDEGAILFDSPVICEYLDQEFGGSRLLPRSGQRRFELMTLGALADGVMDAIVLIRNERTRPEALRSNDWIAWQLAKVHAALDRLEVLAPTFPAEIDFGQIAIGCALGYAEVRLEDPALFATRPQLDAWYRRIIRRPSFQATQPKL